MKSKFFEVRDVGTCIPIVAVKTLGDNFQEQLFYDKGGWSQDTVIILQMNEYLSCSYDSFNWDSRTMKVAHQYIEENFDNLQNFDVIDVQYILGETAQKKVSEIIK